MNPNHYLAVAVWYLFQNRPDWKTDAAVGKTLVSSSMIDRVSARLGRKLSEVPVGFKWFVDGLLDGTYGFGGEESAGASFLRKNGTVWTTVPRTDASEPGQNWVDASGIVAMPTWETESQSNGRTYPNIVITLNNVTVQNEPSNIFD